MLKIASFVLGLYCMLCFADFEYPWLEKASGGRKKREATFLRTSRIPCSISLYASLSSVLIIIDCRQLLYLDSFRFFGTMIIVLKEMLKESALFFLLLLIIVAGFLQSFFGYRYWYRKAKSSLDYADGTVTLMSKVVHSLTQAILMSPNFDYYTDISPPFGLLLFYLFNFIVSVCTSLLLLLLTVKCC